ncbi:uncharacterized protein L3040_003530 [Drepanopeziza brunnea f. sp. 'multigermtubi']|uniref:Uncharacterized protein n=1 Tax=Marssonina brunnea f. sp. multigermtubi (strain MB_m1) TaxID=1072389 RepID=K1WJ51_MARBU|nr:uncharacterized protein MBM_04014 [Drepanopeziza brunnea f. sp. 'multigermtubi' MB_m1]EKD17645.1 hypothetical protein MBM_04014 [Drepanopeziza brunnea f. sp. 'multigermtubi' MB_m1]KAJ5046283.1 hypothetical protein L3040_003530 [Drepanopeziza brunnea f. sp. 'multigermtubi']
MDDVRGQQTSEVLDLEAGAGEAHHNLEQPDLNTPTSSENATSSSASNIDQGSKLPTALPPQSRHCALTVEEIRRHEISRSIASSFLHNLTSGNIDRASDEVEEIRGVWVASLEKAGIRCLDSDSLEVITGRVINRLEHNLEPYYCGLEPAPSRSDAVL